MYEKFKIDKRSLNIVLNAKKFCIDSISNESLLNCFIEQEIFKLSLDERDNIKDIFVSLMNIEEKIQLSNKN